jgi:hypothetical protein
VEETAVRSLDFRLKGFSEVLDYTYMIGINII